MANDTQTVSEDQAAPVSGGPWTHFWDMHTRGVSKLQWEHVFIEAPEDEARKMFAEAFGRHADDSACSCCGEDFSVSESPTLADATGFHRHLIYGSTLVGGPDWRNATHEQRMHANEVGRYLEPDEPVPADWQTRVATSVELGFDHPQSFADFLADPHFDDIGRRREVLILRRPPMTKVDVYQDIAGGWRWRLVARNGRILADSAESYVDEHNAVEAVERVRSGFTEPVKD